VLILQERIPPQAQADAELVLPFEQRQKSRLRTVLAGGEEVGVFLERGTILRGGDFLRGNDGRVVSVVAADEALMEARSADVRALARAAYHLGNRHTPVQIGEGWVRFASDHVLGEMVAGLGVSITAIHAPFEPESGAYAGGHHHSSEAKHAGVIHDFAPRADSHHDHSRDG
jgi:urease accessory protein